MELHHFWLDEDVTGRPLEDLRAALRYHLEAEHGRDLSEWPDAGVALLDRWHDQEHGEHVHEPIVVSEDYGWGECVAHGGVTYTEACSCGAVRYVEENADVRNVGSWQRS